MTTETTCTTKGCDRAPWGAPKREKCIMHEKARLRREARAPASRSGDQDDGSKGDTK